MLIILAPCLNAWHNKHMLGHVQAAYQSKVTECSHLLATASSLGFSCGTVCNHALTCTNVSSTVAYCLSNAADLTVLVACQCLQLFDMLLAGYVQQLVFQVDSGLTVA